MTSIPNDGENRVALLSHSHTSAKPSVNHSKKESKQRCPATDVQDVTPSIIDDKAKSALMTQAVKPRRTIKSTDSESLFSSEPSLRKPQLIRRRVVALCDDEGICLKNLTYRNECIALRLIYGAIHSWPVKA